MTKNIFIPDYDQQNPHTLYLLLKKNDFMEMQLVPGDKVRLISGGPEMTIRGKHYDVLANEYSANMFDCIWFAKNKDGKDEVHYCPFQAEELIKTKDA